SNAPPVAGFIGFDTWSAHLYTAAAPAGNRGVPMADAPQQSTTVLVVGAGAIGAFYGGLLARGGAEGAVVCRSCFYTVRPRGFDIRSPMGDFVFRPVQVLRSAAECATPPDVLLLAVKAVRGLDRVALVRAAVGPRTVIVLFGNGIGIERELAEAFPDNELV